jgi:Gas vesicle synthesis protein GvpO
MTDSNDDGDLREHTMPAAPAQQPTGDVGLGTPTAADRRQPLELITRAKAQLQNLTGYGIDSVSGFEKADSGWRLSVTVTELHRIPAATDVLASYEVDLDEAGNIIGYHRGKRYFRDQVGDIL